MKRVVTCSILAALAAVTHTPGAVRASAPHPADSVAILVDGAPQTRYAHEGRWYIEALRGREYAIRLRNPYGVRVAVALSVDGLNTIDAQRSTARDARKWVIDPHGTVTISGWQTSRTAARRFEFTSEERSYARALGQDANLGVIAAAFFRERPAAVTSFERGDHRDRREAPAPAAPQADASAAAGRASGGAVVDEYAATGMGRVTDHRVTQIYLDLENAPAHTVQIRYEYRPQLVALGILRPGPDPLRRRERASGFEPGFSPVPR